MIELRRHGKKSSYEMGCRCDECRSAAMIYQLNHRRALREEILQMLGGVCVSCGFADPRALQVDHVNGDGSRDPAGRNTSSLLTAIKTEPERYQLLCANCNWIKRAENQEHGIGRR